MIAVTSPIVAAPTLSASVATRDLKNALAFLVKVARKSYIPILANVLIESDGDALTLRAYDLNQELTSRVSADVTTPGSICANAKEMLAFVKSVGASHVSLKAHAESLECAAGEDVYSLNTLPIDDFPKFDWRDPICAFSLPSSDLRTLIEKTAFAVSTEETRYYLNGVYLHAFNGFLRSVATDGQRLVWCDVAGPSGCDLMPGCIVPNAALPLIETLSKNDLTVSVVVAHMQMMLTAPGMTLRTKLIDGLFPDYNRIIVQTPKSVEIDRKALIEKLKMLTPSPARFAAAVKLDFGADRMTLSRRDPDSGDKSATLACVSAESCEIGFNSHYLLSILATIDAPRVRLDFSDSGAPAILRAAGGLSNGRDERQGAVIMPMRV